MENLPSLLSSQSIIRFQDCDPYNHLNNSRYIDYFFNAREDQVLEAYGLNIYALAHTHGIGWVVAHNQIAYIKPANLMENVRITSKIIRFESRWMDVEFIMSNGKSGELRAFMWTRFVHVDIRSASSIEHSAEFIEMFNSVLHPVEDTDFQSRLKTVRQTSAQEVR